MGPTVLLVLALAFSAVIALPPNQQRIVGGQLVTISMYPYMGLLQSAGDSNIYWNACGSVIVNSRYILTAAHCIETEIEYKWRVSVGSTYSGPGGDIYNIQSFISHPNYNIGARYNNDIALLRTSSAIRFGNNVKMANIAKSNHVLAGGEWVWAVGWGHTTPQGAGSYQLRAASIQIVNQDTCMARYRELGRTITENMMCAGALDVGGRDHCTNDDGGPIVHQSVVVGIISWRDRCGHARYPGVNTRVSQFSTWIEDNANDFQL